MSSIRGFRCSVCHAELITGRSGLLTASDRIPPILCCGRPLQALRPDQIVTAAPIRRRVAHCRRCGYMIDLIVHPAGPLVCMLCQAEFEVSTSRPDACDGVAVHVASSLDVGA